MCTFLFHQLYLFSSITGQTVVMTGILFIQNFQKYSEPSSGCTFVQVILLITQAYRLFIRVLFITRCRLRLRPHSSSFRFCLPNINNTGTEKNKAKKCSLVQTIGTYARIMHFADLVLSIYRYLITYRKMASTAAVDIHRRLVV